MHSLGLRNYSQSTGNNGESNMRCWIVIGIEEIHGIRG
jgi:hypothetical protein